LVTPIQRHAPTAADAQRELEALADRDQAEILSRFFKTGPGEYGERDRFLGIRVPTLRKKARDYRALTLDGIADLLRSDLHEIRLFALILMVERCRQKHAGEAQAVRELYLRSTRFVNNWDLVDLSAPHIVGPVLTGTGNRLLHRLTGAEVLWERRIGIVGTFHGIRNNTFDATLEAAERLLHDPEDLIHKAVGWMLREVGKRDMRTEEGFLRRHYPCMPRTMLRYAIERFPEPRRRAYLRGNV